MNRLLKTTVCGTAFIAATVLLTHAAINAALYEIQTAPKPPVDVLKNWCQQCEPGACEAYRERIREK